jgi:alkylation response protein AidB-like acyl-CoA dehydrogenase
MEELGRSLCCAPYFGSAVLAAEALREAAAAESMVLLPPIASGARIASLALAEPGGGWAPAEVRMQAVQHGDAYRLTGIKRYVLDGLAAQDLLVVARVAGSGSEGELALFHLAADAPGVSRRALQTLDPTRRQAEIIFETAGASRVSTAGDCSRALDTVLDRARIALASEMVGGAQALFDRAVEYAKLRMQFGRPIGSFQAIKHKCAELLLELELAKAAAYYAAAAVDADDAALPSLASLAKATASEAYMHIAEECIQIHGGIGFTWDSDVHLWFKRAKSSEVLLGTPAFHRERYVQTLEEAAA